MQRMPVSMLELRMTLVPVFLLAQSLLVHWAAGRERAPGPPALMSFPSGSASGGNGGKIRSLADVAADLRADRSLSRTYAHTSKGSVANLFAAWFQSQRGGVSQSHSPKVCLPAWGWTPAVTGEITLDTARSYHSQPLHHRQPWTARCSPVLVSGAAPCHGGRVGGQPLVNS
jgi:hypothetical protein